MSQKRNFTSLAVTYYSPKMRFKHLALNCDWIKTLYVISLQRESLLFQLPSARRSEVTVTHRSQFPVRGHFIALDVWWHGRLNTQFPTHLLYQKSKTWEKIFVHSLFFPFQYFPKNKNNPVYDFSFFFFQTTAYVPVQLQFKPAQWQMISFNSG